MTGDVHKMKTEREIIFRMKEIELAIPIEKHQEDKDALAIELATLKWVLNLPGWE
jgi:hypothetical protein